MIKNLFDKVLVDAIKERIQRLHPGSERLWGTMTLVQTVTHCTSALEMGMGSIHPKRAAFPARMIGPMIKPLVLRDDKPLRRNSPSSPELFKNVTSGCDLQRERATLITAIDSFTTQGAAGCSRNPHPFFGQLTPQEWAILMYKHLDHHLRQFSV